MHLNKTTYLNLISTLRGLNLNDVADDIQVNLIDAEVKNKVERSESLSTENSDCITIDTSEDDSSRSVTCMA